MHDQRLVFRLQTDQEAARLRGLDQEARWALQEIETSAERGISTKELKAKGNLQQQQLTKALKELETRIAKVLNLGFEDCATVGSGFKLVDSFGDMLERDFIQSDLETKQLELILVYAEELKEVQELFTHDQTGQSSKGKFFEREGPPLYINMPPVSGALAWVQGPFQQGAEDGRFDETPIGLAGVNQ